MWKGKILYCFVWSYMISDGSVLSRMAPYGPVWSSLVPNGSICCRRVMWSPYDPVWSHLVLYSQAVYCIVPYVAIGLFGPVWSLMVPHCPLWFCIVTYGPHYSCMVPYSPVWSCMVFRLFRIGTRFVWIFTNIAKIFTRIIRLVRITTSLEIAQDIKS